MGEHFFVSYSAVDGVDFALSLADRLAAGPPSYQLWVDRRELQPGEDWDEQLVEAIRGCRGLLFVMTADSVRAGSVSKDEWVRALKYKKPVIPLRLDAGAELPFRLETRQFVDFSDFAMGVARLRDYLAWTSTPEGVLSELRTRRADAERELPRADLERRPQIEKEIVDLDRRIAAQQQAIDDPLAAQAQTSERIEAGLERARQPEKPAPEAVVSRARFVNPPPMAAPVYFQDRHVETGQIGDFVRTAGLRVMTVAGRGGLGKTAMACRLLKALERGRLPDGGGELAVAGVVYLSPVGGHPVNFPNLFADLCRLLPADRAEVLSERYRDPQQTPAELMLALLEAFPAGSLAGPSVVLLDNLEDLIDGETRAMTDPLLDEALRAVLTGPDHGVKLILTTRVAPRELLLIEPGRQRRLNLDEGLGSPFAENILRAMDPDASLGLQHAPDQLLTLARERTRGFPRALEALAAILSADRDTTLPELLAEAARLPGNVVEALVGEAFSRLDPLAQQVMQALAVLPVPVPAVAIDYLLQPHRATIDAAPTLSRLINMAFVRRDTGQYYLHQVDRDYALARLPAGEPADRDSNPPPFTQQALRHRGAAYFEATRTPREMWKTLDDLGPQLAEYEIRCQSSDYDAAATVLLDIDEYLYQWGHYRLTIELHNRLQSHLTDPWIKAAALSGLGTVYKVTGEIKRAIEHFQQALAIAREISDRRAEGVALTGLANGYGTLGQTEKAIDHYQQALTIDRETGERDDEAVDLTGLANGYETLGQTERAIEHFQRALAISRETGNRGGEAAALGGLANSYETLGQTERAIEHFQRALAISRETGNRGGQAAALSGLANGYETLGQTERAIEHNQQALAIYRETGNRGGEASALNNLGWSEAELGHTETAIEHYQQALAISRETGNRGGEASALDSLGVAYADQRALQTSAEYCLHAVTISDETGDVQVRSWTRLTLAKTQLLAGDLTGCRKTIEAANGYDYPPASAEISLIQGIVLLRQGSGTDAVPRFAEAVGTADAVLQQTQKDYWALNVRALALCGLALTGDPSRIDEAITTFRAARAITTAPGILDRTLRLLDAIGAADSGETLNSARIVVLGH